MSARDAHAAGGERSRSSAAQPPLDPAQADLARAKRLDRLALLAVLALCALAAALKLHVVGPLSGPGHGDVSFYTTLAKNLASGRGFVIDYVPDFLGAPQGLPHPATSYWAPLVSLWVALWMKLFGSTFAVAKAAMVALSSLAPALGYATGRAAFGARRYGLYSALALALFEGGLHSASVPQTHALTLLIGGAWILCALRAKAHPRALLALGPLIGLACWNRGDGLFLWAALALLWLCGPQGRFGLRTWMQLALGYALVMAPLWAIQVHALGRPMPRGQARAVLMTDYAQLYALPESLTLERFLEAGPARIADSRLRALGRNAVSIATGPAVGNQRITRLAQLEPAHWAVLALALAGWIALARRRYAALWCYVLAYYALDSLLLAETGVASIRATLYGIYPLLFAGGACALERVGARLLRAPLGPTRATIASGAALVLTLAAIGWSNVQRAAETSRQGSVWIERVRFCHLAIVERMLAPHGLEHARLMALDTHQLHAHTGLELVQIPAEPEPVIHRVALQFGVRALLLLGELAPDSPHQMGFARLGQAPERWRLIERRPIGPLTVSLYEVLPGGAAPPATH